MVANVVSDDKIFNFSVFGELHEDFFVEIFKVVNSVNQVTFLDIHTICFGNCSSWVLIQVLENHGLGKWWFVVQPGAGITMTTGSYFKIKWTVDFILFGTEYFCESFSHNALWRWP